LDGLGESPDAHHSTTAAMRTFPLLLAVPALGLAILAQHATAQAVKLYESAGEVASPPSTPEDATLTGLTLLGQADTIVAMAQASPSGAATAALARQSGRAAQAASDALEVAATNYSNGNYASGDSAARVAIAMAELANQALERPSPTLVIEPNPAPGVLITQAGNDVPNSYAGLSPQPFGATPAGPYPPMLRDSLPFGATPIVGSPSKKPPLIAP